MSWQDLTRLVGRSVGRAERAEKLVADVEDLFGRARAAYPAFAGATAVMGYLDPAGYGVLASRDTRFGIMRDLGFRIPPEIDELAGDQFYLVFSAEQVELLEADVLAMTTAKGDRDELMRSDPLFARLDVVTQGRDVHIRGEESGGTSDRLMFPSVLSLPGLIDEIVPKLAAAVDGDPATEVPR